VLAQSSAAAACMAIDAHQTVQQVGVQQLQELLKENPLMDGSIPEILVDDNDSLSTTITGNWKKQAASGYGPSWLLAMPSRTPQRVQFIPHISVPGSYTLYAYVPVVDSAASQMHYIISNGTTKDVIIPTPTHAEGQTSGEWVSLGWYTLQKGNNISVTITTKDADGHVAADAILFVPVKK